MHLQGLLLVLQATVDRLEGGLRSATGRSGTRPAIAARLYEAQLRVLQTAAGIAQRRLESLRGQRVSNEKAAAGLAEDKAAGGKHASARSSKSSSHHKARQGKWA